MEANEVNSVHHMVMIDDLGGLKRRVNIVFDDVKTNSAVEKSIKLVKKNYKIKGYRKGKASSSVVLKLYKNQVQNIAKELLANDGFMSACIEQKLIPLSTPSIEEFSFELDGTFKCSILVDQKPTISPVGYVGMQLVKPEINKEELREQINNSFRDQFSKEKTIDVVEIGSDVVIDFVAKDLDGKEITSTKDQKFTIRQGMKEPFGENLVGLKVSDETVILNTVFPEDYPDKAGEPLVVEMKVKSITITEQPDDEFLYKKFGLNSLEDLNRELEYSVEVESNKKERAALEESIVNNLLELNDFNIPEDWVEQEKKYFFSQIGVESPDQQLLDYANEMATRNVKRTFILDAIYDVEHQLKITQEEIDVVLKKEAESRGIGTLSLKEELKKNNMLDAIIGSIRNSKVINYILSQAQIIAGESSQEECDFEIPKNPLE